jgi:hypothetical protein
MRLSTNGLLDDRYVDLLLWCLNALRALCDAESASERPATTDGLPSKPRVLICIGNFASCYCSTLVDF